MIVHVQLFARARELAETSVATIDLPAGSTVRDVKDRLRVQYPRLHPLLSRSMIAVNDDYATEDFLLPADAIVAMIPPVSGG